MTAAPPEAREGRAARQAGPQTIRRVADTGPVVPRSAGLSGPPQQSVPGEPRTRFVRGAYWLRSEGDPTRGASVLFCDTREHAHAAHEAALAVMREHRPNVAVRVAASGTTSVLAMT